MTKEAIIQEIRKHPPKEQREIIEAVWNLGEMGPPLDDEQRAELVRRLRDYQTDPEQGLPWEEVRERVEASFDT